MSATPPAGEPAPARRPSRRLRPEIAAALAARRRDVRLNELYEKPVGELEPTDLAEMRRAFFRG